MLLFMLLWLCANGVQGQDDVIVTGEHFDDVVALMDGSHRASKNTVLLMHSPKCIPQVTEWKLPLIAYMFFFVHDVDQLTYVWYNTDDRDDLWARYVDKSTSCQVGIFFRQGQLLSDVPERWDSDMETDIVMWTWDRIKVKLSFINRFGQTLLVMHEGLYDSWPQRKAEFIPSGSTVDIYSYPGYKVYVRLTDRVTTVYMNHVQMKDKTITIEKFMSMPNIQRTVDKEKQDIEKAVQHRHGHHSRFVMTLKQPLFVQNYTEIGYKKMRIPQDLYKYIVNKFQTNYANRREEGSIKNEIVAINKMDVMTAMIDLDEEAEKHIAEGVEDILEEWCGCKLKFNIGYGIREYYKGNLLFNHVDRVQTHVISTILQVDQDIESEDWLLEVIGYDGIRKEVKLLPGDMLLYESAKLIHGRPKIFQGRSFANLFFHFAPVTGWNYEVKGGDLVNPINDKKESLVYVKSDFIKGRSMFVKDEL